MGKAATDVQIPGAPAASSAPATAPAADTAGAGAASQANPDDSAAELAARDAEIAALRAQLAAAQNAPAAPSLVVEADGPNSKRYRAESKHLTHTTAELDALVRRGKVKLTDHHVLCKDGWYVNPAADREAREDLR